jgi:HEAT repeat protein
MRPVLLAFALALALPLAGCFSDDDHGRSDAQSLSVHEGDAATAAIARLARRGRSAIPAIEAALHTAKPAGRKNLVTALRKIGDADAIPLLRHVALYDDEESVRHEAEWTLQGWAAELDARGEKARRAMREIEERRGREAAG